MFLWAIKVTICLASLENFPKEVTLQLIYAIVGVLHQIEMTGFSSPDIRSVFSSVKGTLPNGRTADMALLEPLISKRSLKSSL